MQRFTTRIPLAWVAFFVAIGFTATLSAQTQTLRIVTYNIEDDIGSFSGRPAFRGQA